MGVVVADGDDVQSATLQLGTINGLGTMISIRATICGGHDSGNSHRRSLFLMWPYVDHKRKHYYYFKIKRTFLVVLYTTGN